MADSIFPDTQHNSSQYVESVGAILFRRLTKQICLLHHLARDEYQFPKGRRNVGESRQLAALRKVTEETGYQTPGLLQLYMQSHATPAPDVKASMPSSHPDQTSIYSHITEPVMLQIRHLPREGNVELIWWYAAAVTEEEAYCGARGPGDEQFEVRWCNYQEAQWRLTCLEDREVVKRTVEVVTWSGH